MMLKSTPPWEIPHRPDGAWLRDHARFFLEVLKYFALNVFTTLFVITLMSVAIALPAGLWLISDYLDRGSWVWPNQDGFNVYFNADASIEDIQVFQTNLVNHDSVADSTLITKNEALKEFLQAADLSSVMTDLTENPLPNTLTVHVKPVILPSEVEELVSIINADNIVESVSYDPDVLVRFSAINSVVDQLLWILSATFCVFAVFVSSSAVRVSIQHRLQEIHILYTMGAPNRLLRGQFLWCGVIYGVISGYFAAVLLSLVLITVAAPLKSLAESYGVIHDLTNLDWVFFVVLISIGLALGLTGAYYATWRHMREMNTSWAN